MASNIRTRPRTTQGYRDHNAALFAERKRLEARRAALRSAAAPNSRLIERTERQLSRLDDEIVVANEGIAVGYAHRFARAATTHDVDDLVAAAMLGLYEAVPGFDPARGHFAMYALMFIKRRVSAMVTQIDFPDLSKADFEARPKVLAAHRYLGQLHGRTPTHVEVGAECGVSPRLVRRVLEPVRTHLMSQPVHRADNGDDALTWGDVLAETVPGVHDEAVRVDRLYAEQCHQVFTSMCPAALSEDQWEVLVRHHGILGDEPERLEDISASVGVSRETVRQWEIHALAHLSHPSVLQHLVKPGRVLSGAR